MPVPLLGAVVATVVLVLLQLRWPDGLVGDLSYLGVIGAAAVLGLRGALRRKEDRRAWVLIGTGLALSAFGDAVFYVLSWVGRAPDGLSWCDPWWLAGSTVLTAGVVSLLAGRRGSLDLDALIDATALAVIVGFCAWPFLIAPILDDQSVDMAGRIVTALYPLFDVVIMTLIARVVLGSRNRNIPSQVLGLGMTGWLAADLASMAALRAGMDGYDRWMNAGWMLGCAVMGLALCLPAPLPGPAAQDDDEWLQTSQVGSAIVPLLVPALVYAVGQSRGVAPHPMALLGVMIVLTALVLLRFQRLVRARNDTQRRLAENERFYRALAATSSDAVIVVDASGRIVHDSPTLRLLLFRSGGDGLGRDLIEVIDPVDPGPLIRLFDQALDAPGLVVTAEVDVEDGDVAVNCLDVRAINLLDEPALGGIVITLHDATDRRAAARELSRQALHDPLTGLANRTLFRDRLEQALRRSARTGRDPAVLYLDVDGFKKVNDSLGHEAGDAVLIELSERIRAAVRGEDTVARLGGDEFAVLIEGSATPQDEAAAAAERVLQAIVVPISVGDRSITLSGSVGIEVGGPGSDASSMLRNADIAMYRAKGTGKAQWVLFEPSMRALAIERIELEMDLARAIERGEFRLVYQPFVDLSTGSIAGFEALLRWDHPTYGTLAPDTFVPIAEDTGLIVDIGQWVLGLACRTLAGWQRRFAREGLFMAVNVSGRQVAAQRLVTDVANALHAAGLAAPDLVLEVTETALVGDQARAASRLEELRTLGVRIAIDDFGTGYSSLSYLRQFAVDILKIDQSFVSCISEQAGLPALIRGLLDLGRTLDLDVVAEGIEKEDQRDRLREGGCTYGQGFLFAPGLFEYEAAALLADEMGFEAIAGPDEHQAPTSVST